MIAKLVDITLRTRLRKEFMDVSSHGEVPTPLVQVALGCWESMGILIPHGKAPADRPVETAHKCSPM